MTTPRIAFITGGARGIGAAIARRLAEDGLSIIVADRDDTSAVAVAAALPIVQKGQMHACVTLDVLREDTVASAFAKVEREWGAVAVLVCCVGGPVASALQNSVLADTSIADWDATFAFNTRSTFLCIREMLRYGKRRPVADGRIIAISSIGAQVAWNPTGAAYAASKAAILSLTRFAAIEAAPLGMTVNSICPGAIDGPNFRSMLTEAQIEGLRSSTPMQRLGTGDDVAACVAYLASPCSGFTTGSTFDINGGRRMA